MPCYVRGCGNAGLIPRSADLAVSFLCPEKVSEEHVYSVKSKNEKEKTEAAPVLFIV